MNNIIRYLPKVVADIQEFQLICDTETEELAEIYAAVKNAQDAQFVQSADADGVTRLEVGYGLTQTGGDLETRKFQLLSKLNDLPPYSMGWLTSKLNLLLPAGYLVTLDRDTMTLSIETDAAYENVVISLYRELRKAIPANIILQTFATQAIEAQVYSAAYMTTIDTMEVRI